MPFKNNKWMQYYCLSPLKGVPSFMFYCIDDMFSVHWLDLHCNKKKCKGKL